MIRTSYLLLVVVCLSASACGRGKVKEAEARAQAAEAQLVQMNVISEQKDTLMNELMATTEFINDINGELAKIKSLKRGAMVAYQERVIPVSEYRDSMLVRIRELGTRLDDTEQRLKSTQARLRAAAGNDKEQLARIAAFEQTVADYNALVEEQRQQIVTLTLQVDTLRADNERLTFQKASLDTQVAELTTNANTVYYIIGTKKELIARGIVREEGGSRFLLIGGKRGKTMVPGADLNAADFTEIDKTRVFEIDLPIDDKKYAIVSPHGVQHLEQPPEKADELRGSLRIHNPAAFWAQSKFLIIVER